MLLLLIKAIEYLLKQLNAYLGNLMLFNSILYK